MTPSIHIDDADARVHDAESIRRVVGECVCPLPGAVANLWRREHWQVLEQAYDLPDVYVSYIEVRVARADTAIPIKCPRDDLYWLYLLSGGMAIATPDNHKNLVETTENRYRVSYLPSGNYRCKFAKGTHRIFYVVHKPRALFREDSPELDVRRKVIAAVKSQPRALASSDSLSMRDGSAEAVRRFLHAPGNTYLKRKQSMEYLSLDLVFFAHESLNQQAGGKKIVAEWAEKMKDYIDECVAHGTAVDADSIAKRYKMSTIYARTLFKAHYRLTIGAYITDQKLELSARLLDEGEHPSAVARYLGWTPAYFSRAFRAKIGYPPGQHGNQ